MVRVEELSLDEALTETQTIRFKMTNTCRDTDEAANLGADLADLVALLDREARQGRYPEAWKQ